MMFHFSYIYDKIHYECERKEYHFTIFREYLKIFRITILDKRKEEMFLNLVSTLKSQPHLLFKKKIHILGPT